MGSLLVDDSARNWRDALLQVFICFPFGFDCCLLLLLMLMLLLFGIRCYRFSLFFVCYCCFIIVFTPSSLILAKKALRHDNGRKQIIVDIFFIIIHSQPPSEQDGVSGEDNLVVSSSQTKEKESRETAEVRSRIRCHLVKAWEVSFWSANSASTAYIVPKKVWSPMSPSNSVSHSVITLMLSQ